MNGTARLIKTRDNPDGVPIEDLLRAIRYEFEGEVMSRLDPGSPAHSTAVALIFDLGAVEHRMRVARFYGALPADRGSASGPPTLTVVT